MIKEKAIITGSANGIGKAIVKKLYNEGVEVYACDIDGNSLRALKKEVPRINIYTLDVSDYRSICIFFEEINDFECNWLVNNAGIYYGRNLLDYNENEIDKILRVNCAGALYFTKHFARRIINKNATGAIVNMASVSGQEGSSDAV